MTDVPANVVDMKSALENAPVAGSPPDQPRIPKSKLEGMPGMTVRALGVNTGTYFYLDALNQLVPLKAKEHSKLQVQSLFAPNSMDTWTHWPRWNKPKDGDEPKVVGFSCGKAAHDLMDAGAIKGIFNPAEQLRGRGCWRDDAGGLVMHTGNKVYSSINGVANPFKPGLIDGYVYPGAPVATGPSETKGQAGEELLDLIGKWYFNRAVDQRLVFCWIVAAILGGALPWRPVMWLTGDKATGKSTLQDLMTKTVGTIVRAGNATAASIWQNLGHQTLPVQLDELEASEDNRKVNSVVELARVAASGDLILRGGADHVGTQFQARSCFLFSSILIPPISAQDRSRMAIVELESIPQGAPAPVLDDKRLAEIGQGIRHKLFTEWYRFDETLFMYQRALVEMGHSNRTADVFGNLLAAGDLALNKGMPHHDYIDDLIADLKPTSLHELLDTTTEQAGCLQHLLTYEQDNYQGGSKRVISELISHAAGRAGLREDMKLYDAHLQRMGLRVFPYNGQDYLLVANNHQGLMKIFKDTRWAGRSGDTGVWAQALKRFKNDGAFAFPRAVKFAGVNARATALPLDLVLPPATDDDIRPGEMI